MSQETQENRFQKYRRLHKDIMNQRTKDWRKNMTKKQKESKRERERNYSKTKKYREHRHGYYKKLIENLKSKVFELLGGKCNSCGFSDRRAFQIDHIHGGGRKQRSGMSTEKFLKYVLEHSKEFQLLCANCNQIKRIENKEN